MPTTTRSFSQLTDLRSVLTRRMALVVVCIAAMSVSFLLAAAPAGAFISGEFGLQQRKPVWVRHGPLQYHDGPVIHASDSYAIYWDPLELYNPQWMRIIDGYFRNAGEASGEMGNVFGLNAQYGEVGYGTGPAASEKAKEAHATDQSTFRGAYTDTDSYPASGCTEPAGIACLTDQQIRTELQKVIKSGALPGSTGTVPGAKSTPVYYLLTPPGVTVCTVASGPSTCSNSTALENEAGEIDTKEVTHPAETGICGYHSAINPHSASPIVYAVQPWIAGDAGMFTESGSPLMTSGTSSDVLACQNDESLQEPNQIGYNSFSYYGAGLADVIVGDLADEQTNIAVDPLLNGWYQNTGAAENGDPEQGDMCQFVFSTAEIPAETIESLTHAGTTSSETLGSGSYYLHWGFNSSGFLTGKDTAGCWQGATLEPHITAPNPVNAGDVVGLDANESDITLDAAPMGPRQAKEEARLEEEVATLGLEEAGLGAEITKLGNEITNLSTKITSLGNKVTSLDTEIANLSTKITSLGTEISTLRTEISTLRTDEITLEIQELKVIEEREGAEQAGTETQPEEEKYATEEKELSVKRQKRAKERAFDEEQKTSDELEKTLDEGQKTSDEQEKTSDEGQRSTDEQEKKADARRKLIVEEDKRFVEGDKPIAKEEGQLANEHKLIKEREPLIAPIYKWDFGYQENGKEVTEEGEEKASVFHVFPCAKTYTVELTVVDGGGNEAGLPGDVTKEITVAGKPCEEASGGGGTNGGSGSNSTTGGGSGVTAGASATGATTGTNTKTSTPTPAKPIPGPVASAAVVSRSLSTVLKKGLVISYSVNEQVAGQFQVLLASSLAKRVGLHGAPATGLAPGSAPSIVIGKAILVTTKGGRNTVKIMFGKKTAAKLRKLGRVPLTIRLIVRNASSHSPLTTTVISTVTLSR